MRRALTRGAQILIDLGVFVVALGISFLVRFDWAVPNEMWARLAFVLPYVVVLEYAALLALGVHRFAWRYVGLRETGRIFVMAASVIFSATHRTPRTGATGSVSRPVISPTPAPPPR